MLHASAVVVGALLLAVVLWDAFESVVLPRTVSRRLRLARVFYRTAWSTWSAVARSFCPFGSREGFLSLFGPISLLLLLAVWAAGIVVGFGLAEWGLGTRIVAPEGSRGLGTYVYLSGSTLFTLGYGDVTPVNRLGRFLCVAEAGIGLGLLAIVVSYLPVLYQAFSRREVGIAMLDARAGSPPTAGELLLRHARAGCIPELRPLFADWERWSADLLESHLSYPLLTYYRSQHDRQSWLSAITAILDACAFLIVAADDSAEWAADVKWQANMTYAMARHAIIDLALVLSAGPTPAADGDRMPRESWNALCDALRAAGMPVRATDGTHHELGRLRESYEPYLRALGGKLGLALPPWRLDAELVDNWQVSAWDAVGHFTEAPRRARAHRR